MHQYTTTAHRSLSVTPRPAQPTGPVPGPVLPCFLPPSYHSFPSSIHSPLPLLLPSSIFRPVTYILRHSTRRHRRISLSVICPSSAANTRDTSINAHTLAIKTTFAAVPLPLSPASRPGPQKSGDPHTTPPNTNTSPTPHSALLPHTQQRALFLSSSLYPLRPPHHVSERSPSCSIPPTDLRAAESVPASAEDVHLPAPPPASELHARWRVAHELWRGHVGR